MENISALLWKTLSPFVFAVVNARARAVCDVVMNSLLEFADARAFLRAGKHATNPAEKTIVNASRCLC